MPCKHCKKSCEKGHITKELVVTHAFCNVFKWALHFNKLAITHFSSGTMLFQAVNNTATLRASLLNVSPPI